MSPLVVAVALSTPGPVTPTPTPPPFPCVRAQDRNVFPSIKHCCYYRTAWNNYYNWLVDHRLVTSGDYRLELELLILEAEDHKNFWNALANVLMDPWSPEYDRMKMEFIRDVLGPERYYAGWTPVTLPPRGYADPPPSGPL